jgi:purine-nucleoside phosphorylase
VSTPHINATTGAFADTVLLPGDPLRARHIAENLFDWATEVTHVRGMLGFTGEYRGRRLSVMGSGMGIPSISVYATELIRHFGVRRLLRVGTCGAVQPALALGDIIVAAGAGTDSMVNRRRFGGMDFPAIASWPLLRALSREAEMTSTAVAVGPVFSSDLFYAPESDLLEMLTRMGVLAIDMETAGLYGLAAAEGVEALSVCAVADNLVRGEHMTAHERESGVDMMVRLTLDTLSSMPLP